MKARSNPVTIYGIKSCDTMKKARAWLETRGIAYTFYDYKLRGIDQGVLQGWARLVGWETTRARRLH
jgi:arsenate reductase-like glutaredoxin family protein